MELIFLVAFKISASMMGIRYKIKPPWAKEWIESKYEATLEPTGQAWIDKARAAIEAEHSDPKCLIEVRALIEEANAPKPVPGEQVPEQPAAAPSEAAPAPVANGKKTAKDEV